MKRKELEKLLTMARDLSSDHEYISYKAPLLLEELRNVKRVPKDLRDEYDDALRDIEYINDTM